VTGPAWVLAVILAGTWLVLLIRDHRQERKDD
jgi:hypothetical protein